MMVCYFFQVKITFIFTIYTVIMDEEKGGNEDHGKVDDDSTVFHNCPNVCMFFKDLGIVA